MGNNLTNFRLDDRSATVTGGAGGIGRAVALRLAAAGAYVVVLASNGVAAQKITDEIEIGAEAVDANVVDGARSSVCSSILRAGGQTSMFCLTALASIGETPVWT